jgi:hypothetical protein
MNNIPAQSGGVAEFFAGKSISRLRVSGRDLFRRLLPWLVPALTLSAWQLLSVCDLLDITLLPSPLGVARAAWRLSLSGELPRHVWVSSRRAFAGFAVGGGIGFANGLFARQRVHPRHHHSNSEKFAASRHAAAGDFVVWHRRGREGVHDCHGRVFSAVHEHFSRRPPH